MAKRILIAHQSTIPHYRVRFYELLEQMRPREWSFDVVYDTRESTNPRIFLEPVDHTRFQFPILDVKTRFLHAAGRRLLYQPFLSRARQYDVLITDTHLNNLSYPLASALQLAGVKRVFWGHFRDMNVERMGLPKRALEYVKRRLIHSADACFAYTPRTAAELISTGYPAERVQTLYNTIDTRAERARFEALRHTRDAARKQLGLEGRKVLLYVGRLIPEKRIPFLLELYSAAHHADASYHLLVVGTGPMQPAVMAAAGRLGATAMTYLGAISDAEKLAPYYLASDAYILTGMVGLAPLQAFCYNLPAIVFDEPIHSPEVEYLDERNSVMLPRDIKPAEFPGAVNQALQKFPLMNRDSIYHAIDHLALESMAERFIEGVNRVLALPRR